MSNPARPRILITRLSHIGDCVLTLPVLCALRECFPEAFIAWAVEGPSDQLIRGHRALNQVIKVPRGWLKSPRRIAELRRELSSHQFDLVIDPQSLTKSAALGWISAAKRRIGLARPWGRELAPWLNSERVTPRQQHIVPRSLELLRVLGIRNPSVQFHLPIYETARQRVSEMIHDARLEGGYAVINPGATWRSKQWDLHRFGEVANYLDQKHRLPTWVVWAGDDELRQARIISDHSSGSAIVAPATTLQELTALTARARIMISGDTGPLHIAAATGTPCVGLYGATRPEYSGAYGSHVINLQTAYQEGSAKQRRRADNQAMLAISSKQVCQALEQLLSTSWDKVSKAA